jgi:hypothetical protein
LRPALRSDDDAASGTRAGSQRHLQQGGLPDQEGRLVHAAEPAGLATGEHDGIPRRLGTHRPILLLTLPSP